MVVRAENLHCNQLCFCMQLSSCAAEQDPLQQPVPVPRCRGAPRLQRPCRSSLGIATFRLRFVREYMNFERTRVFWAALAARGMQRLHQRPKGGLITRMARVLLRDHFLVYQIHMADLRQFRGIIVNRIVVSSRTGFHMRSKFEHF